MEIPKINVFEKIRNSEPDDIKRVIGAGVILALASHPNGREVTRNAAALHSDLIGVSLRGIQGQLFSRRSATKAHTNE